MEVEVVLLKWETHSFRGHLCRLEKDNSVNDREVLCLERFKNWEVSHFLYLWISILMHIGFTFIETAISK